MNIRDTIESIAKHAGSILLQKRENGFAVSHKGIVDLVTDADKASEKYIIGELSERFPGYSFLAEEQGWSEQRESEYCWVIDPLDGTTNFVHDFPYYSVSIALVKNNEPIVGVVYNPVSDELFSAEKGGGAYRNGEPISVSKYATLQDSLLVTGFCADVAKLKCDNMDHFSEVTKASQGVRRTGSGALDLCHVASGHFEGYWENPINPWDVAAGTLILLEAGGKVTNSHGGSFGLFDGEIIASNGLIHEELVAILNQQ